MAFGMVTIQDGVGYRSETALWIYLLNTSTCTIITQQLFLGLLTGWLEGIVDRGESALEIVRPE